VYFSQTIFLYNYQFNHFLTIKSKDLTCLFTGNELIQCKTADEVLPDLFDLAQFSHEEDDPLSSSSVEGFKSESLDTPQVSVEDLD